MEEKDDGHSHRPQGSTRSALSMNRNSVLLGGAEPATVTAVAAHTKLTRGTILSMLRKYGMHAEDRLIYSYFPCGSGYLRAFDTNPGDVISQNMSGIHRAVPAHGCFLSRQSSPSSDCWKNTSLTSPFSETHCRSLQRRDRYRWDRERLAFIIKPTNRCYAA